MTSHCRGRAQVGGVEGARVALADRGKARGVVVEGEDPLGLGADEVRLDSPEDLAEHRPAVLLLAQAHARRLVLRPGKGEV